MYFIISSLLLLYMFDGYRIIKNVATEKYGKFKELNQVVATQHPERGYGIVIFFDSLNIIAKMYWINMLQWANNSIIDVEGKYTVINYVLNSVRYKIVVKNRRGPSKILKVLGKNHEDISDEIFPFCGPNMDWHGNVFTPGFWNHEMLTFEYSNGDRKHFLKDENIVL